LLLCVKAGINVLEVFIPPSWIFHFRFLPVWAYSIFTFDNLNNKMCG
jgi:hypothetical protein